MPDRSSDGLLKDFRFCDCSNIKGIVLLFAAWPEQVCVFRLADCNYVSADISLNDQSEASIQVTWPVLTNQRPDREGHWTAVWSQCPAALHSGPAVSWDMQHQHPASDWSSGPDTGLWLADTQTLMDITISQSEQEECLPGLFSSFPGEMKTERDWGNPWL